MFCVGGKHMSTIVTLVIVGIIIGLSLRKYIKMSKEGCGCGCSDCPSRKSCGREDKKEI